MPQSNWTKKLEDTQCGFRPERSTTDQIFEKPWACIKDILEARFIDLEKVPREKIWRICLLLAVRSLYCCSDVCVRVGAVKSQPFAAGVGLWQWCALPPLLFTIYMDWIDESTRVLLLKAAGSIICFLRMIRYCWYLLNRVFNMHLIGFQLHATKR